MWTILITAIALGPSALLVSWALYVHFTRPDIDFLNDIDDWGAR